MASGLERGIPSGVGAYKNWNWEISEGGKEKLVEIKEKTDWHRRG